MRFFPVLLLVVFAGCVASKQSVRPDAPNGVKVKFEEVVITGDLELEKMNDEELFAAGTSFYAAEDWAQAARYFGRLADFHLKSIHRRPALYNAGLSHEKLKQWEEALQRFHELSDPDRGTGDALDAAFRVAEVLYHLERFEEASEVLKRLGARTDLTSDRLMEARVQSAICELESGDREKAEKSLRAVIAWYQELPDKELVDEYFPAQAQFFLGEIFRLHYEDVTLDPDKSADQLGKDVEYKAELLLSAQGHYLRAIRTGNGYWATASGSRVGGLYENLYDHMVNAPAPKELNPAEADVYKQELHKKIRILITKAITVYERTLEAAERIGAANPFVEKTRENLARMKELLLAEARAEEEQPEPPPPPKPVAKKKPRT